MTLKLYLTVTMLVSAAIVKAQKADTAQAMVHYKFTHVRDTLNRDKPLTENMVLLVGRQAAQYKSYDRMKREEQMRKSLAEQISAGGTANIRITSPGGPMGPNIEYYQFPNESKFYSKERLFNSYIIQETMPTLNWKVSADTTTINGLACQKATTHFKGRDYTAWFCADLPYRVGPWKLNGLPGLIVEAYDTKKDVVFKFDGLDKVDPAILNATQAADPLAAPGRTIVLGGMDDKAQNPYVIALPANAIKTTPKELAGLKEIMRKDPQAFFQSQMAAMQGQAGGNVAIRSFSMNGAPAGSSPAPTITVQRSGQAGAATVENNPIELPEKK